MTLQWNYHQLGGPIVPAFTPIFQTLAAATSEDIPSNWTFLILAGRLT